MRDVTTMNAKVKKQEYLLSLIVRHCHYRRSPRQEEVGEIGRKAPNGKNTVAPSAKLSLISRQIKQRQMKDSLGEVVKDVPAKYKVPDRVTLNDRCTGQAKQ